MTQRRQFWESGFSAGRLVADVQKIEAGLNGDILIRIPASHRKRDRFVGLLGRKPEFLYSFSFSGHFTYVSSEELERVKHLVTRARVDGEKLLKCWNG